jgi:hypothetical protein
MASQIRQLEVENRSMRDDLEQLWRLIPAGGGRGGCHRLQAEMLSATQLKAGTGDPAGQGCADFNGSLELTLSGMQGDKPWTMTIAGLNCCSSNGTVA